MSTPPVEVNFFERARRRRFAAPVSRAHGNLPDLPTGVAQSIIQLPQPSSAASPHEMVLRHVNETLESFRANFKPPLKPPHGLADAKLQLGAIPVDAAHMNGSLSVPADGSAPESVAPSALQNAAPSLAPAPVSATRVAQPAQPAQPEGFPAATMSPLQRLRARAAANQSEDLPAPDQPWESDEESAPDVRPGAQSGAQSGAQRAAESIEGVVSEVRQYGDWAVANITLDNRRQRRLSGSAVSKLKEGSRYRVEGLVRQHPQHGESIEVSVATPVVNADKLALQRYLVKHFDGVGVKKAEQYLQALEAADPALLEDLSQVLVHEPWLLDVRAVLSAQPRVRVSPADVVLPTDSIDPADPAAPAKASSEDGDDRDDFSAASQAETRQDIDSARLSRMKEAQRKAAVESLSRAFMLGLGGGTTLFKEPQAKALAEHFWHQFGADPDLLNKAMGSLRADPYAPVLSVSGYGFVTADALGKRMGIDPKDERRLRVYGAWVVQLACARRGHSHLKVQEFVAEIRRAMPGTPIQGVLNACAAKNTLVIDSESGRIYVPKLWLAERRVSAKIAERLHSGKALTSRSYDSVVDFLKTKAHRINERFASEGLDEAQIHAVAAIVTAPTSLHVLTGGPGTGKTTIMECVVWMLKHRKHFTFAAPTGKAAKVLSNRLSALQVSASTICSMLRGTDEAGYEINADKPLETDVLVVDESTMVGIETADALLQATQAHTHIIFLGDPGTIDAQGRPDKAGQLPSISPGRFMHDLQSVAEVQKLHLTKVFRNGGGILDVVREVAEGNLDVRDRETVKFDPLPEPEQALQTVIARYLEIARRDGMANTVLIMPRRAGDVNEPGWNVTWSNAVLREILNRDGPKMPGTIYRLGDRIIVRKNIQAPVPTLDDLDGKVTTLDAKHLAKSVGIEDPRPAAVGREDDLEAVKQVRLVNGDAGFILGWRMDANNPRMGQPQWLELLLDDGRRVWLPGEEIAILDHAYALTVHAVQGSEYRNVLFCATDGGENFMNANMLLTALSRAKSYLHVWGDEGVLKRVAATKLPDRNSGVTEMVAAQMLTQEEDGAETLGQDAQEQSASGLDARQRVA